MENNTHINNPGVHYAGILKEIRRSGNYLQPIFEAITNSLEAIVMRSDKKDNGRIGITIYSNENLNKELEFEKLVIEDNGIGFDEDNFNRFILYKDDRKGYNNKGSGRLQLIHTFNNSNYVSIFKENDKYKQRSFVLSKSASFLKNNAIIFHKETVDAQVSEPATILTLSELLEEADKKDYNALTALTLKETIVGHYISYFCANKDKIPAINLKHYNGNNLIEDVTIETSDIPQFEHEKKIDIYYSKLSHDAKSIEKTSNKEEFTIKSFRIPQAKLDKNAIKLTSKEEIVENIKIDFDLLSPSEHIEGNRYLFLVSSPYIDQRDNDVRGNLKIANKHDFKKQTNIFSIEEILLDDIEEKVNDNVASMYGEIQQKKDEHNQEIEKHKSMFLLNPDTLEHLSIGLNDNEEKILGKVYEAEAKVVAKKDAEIKKKIDELDTLDTTSPKYEEEFDKAISELVKQIPLQNRTALTHYVARRRLVLELFDKILSKKLTVQNDGSRAKDEKLLHNLIFQQTTTTPGKSDLWLINEDFIYFKGTSESLLNDVKINGEKLLKEKTELSDEEEKFRASLGEDRYQKRPDILLFPDEGKCIIIEFKSPDVTVSQHLTQVNNYATLIRNFSKDDLQFDTFYGFLIGEGIDANDVRSHDADFKNSTHFDYLFRPSKVIAALFGGRKDGAIYTEVIKYSTLLQRAKMRNQIFLEKIS